jgi:hypothetical protein
LFAGVNADVTFAIEQQKGGQGSARFNPLGADMLRNRQQADRGDMQENPAIQAKLTPRQEFLRIGLGLGGVLFLLLELHSAAICQRGHLPVDTLHKI